MVDEVQGTLVLRNYRSVNPTIPAKLTRVKAAAVRDELPADTPRITPEERAKTLAYRRDGVMKLMGH